MHVYLIGMPGAGKTTMGKALAAQLNRKLIDLDVAIEEYSGLSISRLFEEKGEAYFRELESETLKTVSFSAEKLVVATGGGTPCFQDNMAFMQRQGLIVYLKAAPETLAERLLLTDLASRPLIKNKSKPVVLSYLRETLAGRGTFYEQAGIIFESRWFRDAAVKDLAELIERFEQNA